MSLNNLGITARLADRLAEAKTSYARSAEILRDLIDIFIVTFIQFRIQQQEQ